MASSPPFVDPDAKTVDFRQLLHESVPLFVLVGLVGVLTWLPLFVGGGLGATPLLFTLVRQLLLAVGSALVLLYVIARGIQLAGV